MEVEGISGQVQVDVNNKEIHPYGRTGCGRSWVLLTLSVTLGNAQPAKTSKAWSPLTPLWGSPAAIAGHLAVSVVALRPDPVPGTRARSATGDPDELRRI